MGVGRGEQRGLCPPGFVVILVLVVKNNFTTSVPLLKKFSKNPVVHPLEKILPTPMAVVQCFQASSCRKTFRKCLRCYWNPKQ